MIIQIIGLPCSGKTYVLKKIKKLYKDYPLNFFDLASSSKLPNFKLSTINIIESAQGLDIPTDVAIRLNIKETLYKKNCQKRNFVLLTSDDKSFLNYYAIPSHYDVFSQQELCKILSLIIKNEVKKNAFKNKKVPCIPFKK